MGLAAPPAARLDSRPLTPDSEGEDRSPSRSGGSLHSLRFTCWPPRDPGTQGRIAHRGRHEGAGGSRRSPPHRPRTGPHVRVRHEGADNFMTPSTYMPTTCMPTTCMPTMWLAGMCARPRRRPRTHGDAHRTVGICARPRRTRLTQGTRGRGPQNLNRLRGHAPRPRLEPFVLAFSPGHSSGPPLLVCAVRGVVSWHAGAGPKPRNSFTASSRRGCGSVPPWPHSPQRAARHRLGPGRSSVTRSTPWTRPHQADDERCYAVNEQRSRRGRVGINQPTAWVGNGRPSLRGHLRGTKHPSQRLSRVGSRRLTKTTAIRRLSVSDSTLTTRTYSWHVR
jgi:hypothetical protein